MPGRRPKDEKPPPPMGPGSRVVALPPAVRRHVMPILSMTPIPDDKDDDNRKNNNDEETGPGSDNGTGNKSPVTKRKPVPAAVKGYELRFSTTSSKSLPEEFYKNEELQNTARLLDAPNNRIKRVPKEIGDLNALQTIDLHNNIIAKLPASIGKLPSLNLLDVSANGLRSLPATLGRSPALTEVRASGNRLRTVPARLPALLEALDLSDNAIRKLKKTIYRVPMSLNISHNQLADLPPVSIKNASIRRIDASHNHLERLPAGIDKLVRLLKLNVANNSLSALPREVGNMRYLSSLDVSRNQLTSLPEEICRLDFSLEELRIAENAITELPASFGRFRRLRILDASGNEIEQLPVGFDEVKSLVYLDLSKNRLADVDAVVGLFAVETLNLSDNVIEQLPDDVIESMKSLVTLDISRNKFVRLPRGIGRIRPLKNVLAAGNNITSITDDLGSDQLLEFVDLSDNRIESLPSDLRRFRSVGRLLLGGNQIFSVPRAFADHLASVSLLDVSRNQLTTFPIPRSVSVLRAADNPLHSARDDPKSSVLAHIGDDEHARKVTDLDLAGLRLTEVPAAVTSLRLLMSLGLARNAIECLPERIDR